MSLSLFSADKSLVKHISETPTSKKQQCCLNRKREHSNVCLSFNLIFPEGYDTEVYFIIAQLFHLLRNSPNALVLFHLLSCTTANIINGKTTVEGKKKKQQQKNG